MKKTKTYKNLLFIDELTDVLLINSCAVKDLGIRHGKMGITLFFEHLRNVSGNNSYRDISEMLLQEVIEDIDLTSPIGLNNGLIGIATGIVYLQKSSRTKTGTETLKAINEVVLHDAVNRPLSEFLDICLFISPGSDLTEKPSRHLRSLVKERLKLVFRDNNISEADAELLLRSIYAWIRLNMSAEGFCLPERFIPALIETTITHCVSKTPFAQTGQTLQILGLLKTKVSDIQRCQNELTQSQKSYSPEEKLLLAVNDIFCDFIYHNRLLMIQSSESPVASFPGLHELLFEKIINLEPKKISWGLQGLSGLGISYVNQLI